jgi:hypothetical protein
MGGAASVVDERKKLRAFPTSPDADYIVLSKSSFLLYDLSKTEVFKVLISSFEIDSLLELQIRRVYMISSLHCRSGKESPRLYLDFDSINRMYDDTITASYERNWMYLDGLLSDKNHSRNRKTVEEFIVSHLEMISVNYPSQHFSAYEISSQRLNIDPIDNTEIEIMKPNRIVNHTDTFRRSASLNT